MQTGDVFEKIRARLLAGVMFHADMANYFGFLNLKGFEEMHEYHFLEEAAELRKVERYFVEHFNELIPPSQPDNVAVISDFMYSHARSEMSADAKRRSVRDGMVKWLDWETGSKALYKQCYTDLCNMGEISAAMMAQGLVCDVDEEIKHANNLALTLEGVSYYMGDITSWQDGLCEKFERKLKGIWG